MGCYCRYLHTARGDASKFREKKKKEKKERKKAFTVHALTVHKRLGRIRISPDRLRKNSRGSGDFQTKADRCALEHWSAGEAHSAVAPVGPQVVPQPTAHSPATAIRGRQSTESNPQVHVGRGVRGSPLARAKLGPAPLPWTGSGSVRLCDYARVLAAVL